MSSVLHKSHWLDLHHPSLAFLLLLKTTMNQEKLTTVQCVWTCKGFYSIPLCFTVQVVRVFHPVHPSPLTSAFGGRPGALRYAGAHSFMSDTELSHCEQFLFGSMLTNELSSASSEKSSRSGVRSRKSQLRVSHSARRKILIQLVKLYRFLTEIMDRIDVAIALSPVKVITSVAFMLWFIQMRNPAPLRAKKSLNIEKNKGNALIKTNCISLLYFTDH